MAKDKFKDRYVLGEGHPWAMGLEPYYEINLHDGPYASDKRIPLKFPRELWSRDLPKYRLVLERL